MMSSFHLIDATTCWNLTCKNGVKNYLIDMGEISLKLFVLLCIHPLTY